MQKTLFWNKRHQHPNIKEIWITGYKAAQHHLRYGRLLCIEVIAHACYNLFSTFYMEQHQQQLHNTTEIAKCERERDSFFHCSCIFCAIPCRRWRKNSNTHAQDLQCTVVYYTGGGAVLLIIALVNFYFLS